MMDEPDPPRTFPRGHARVLESAKVCEEREGVEGSQLGEGIREREGGKLDEPARQSGSSNPEAK